jgi:hypothetical protein
MSSQPIADKVIEEYDWLRSFNLTHETICRRLAIDEASMAKHLCRRGRHLTERGSYA